MSLHKNFDLKTHTLTIIAPVKFNELYLEEFKSCYEINNVLIKPKIYAIDFFQTEIINSAGLISILSLFYYAKDRKAVVMILNCKAQVKRILIENQYNEIMKLG